MERCCKIPGLRQYARPGMNRKTRRAMALCVGSLGSGEGIPCQEIIDEHAQAIQAHNKKRTTT